MGTHSDTNTGMSTYVCTYICMYGYVSQQPKLRRKNLIRLKKALLRQSCQNKMKRKGKSKKWINNIIYAAFWRCAFYSFIVVWERIIIVIIIIVAYYWHDSLSPSYKHVHGYLCIFSSSFLSAKWDIAHARTRSPRFRFQAADF